MGQLRGERGYEFVTESIYVHIYIYTKLYNSMKMTQETKLHSPNLDTVLMVEKLISQKGEFATKHQLWRALPRQVQYPTFNRILKYLEDSNKIMVDKDGSVMWVFMDNPKLEKLYKDSVRLR